MIQQLYAGYGPNKTWKQGLEQYLHTSVHCGAVHKRQKVGQPACLASDEWILNVHACTAVLLSYKKQ